MIRMKNSVKNTTKLPRCRPDLKSGYLHFSLKMSFLYCWIPHEKRQIWLRKN